MWEQVTEMLRASALHMVESVANFLPGLVGLLLILLSAIVVGVLARAAVLRGLRSLQFDQRIEYVGLGSIADWSVVGGPSMFVARLVMWVIVIAGMLAGLSVLDAALPEAFARSLLGYIPNVLAALLIVAFGTILARFLARSVLIGAVNMKLQAARLMSVGVKWLVLLLAWTIALEHLGVGRGLLTLAFGILFGGVVLAISLALGLGSKELVRRQLERQITESDERPDRLTHV